MGYCLGSSQRRGASDLFVHMALSCSLASRRSIRPSGDSYPQRRLSGDPERRTSAGLAVKYFPGHPRSILQEEMIDCELAATAPTGPINRVEHNMLQ
eukprot:scaffold274917_cov32-Tisochrysis_lutea.AAC.1